MRAPSSVTSASSSSVSTLRPSAKLSWPASIAAFSARKRSFGTIDTAWRVTGQRRIWTSLRSIMWRLLVFRWHGA
jgi:hypothetical protein